MYKAGTLQYNLPDVRHICPKETLAPNSYMAGTLFTSGKWPLKVEVLSRFKVIRYRLKVNGNS